jgi:two-component system CheB/CheR fusion protein
MVTRKRTSTRKKEARLPSPAATSPAAQASSADGAPEERAPGFPIVGIGASAGGLAAFEAFFSGMPAEREPGMAFVLVQHLAPDHKSILAELVRRYTRMEVLEVEDGVTVRPNCAYIIPPNRDMALSDGRLHLSEPAAPRGQRAPIDFFFRSLAQDQRERAIGILLSGTGTDGTFGARAIKGEGGIVMVQALGTTEHDGMPRSALATGLVDYELPPAEMAAQLIAYAGHAFGRRHRSAAASPPEADSALRRLLVTLRAETGHDFSGYKPSTVQRRIERRMAVHQIDTLEDYARFAHQTRAEVEALFRDLLIGVTSFFRDPGAFAALEERVIPGLFENRPADDAIRVWSPGCSSGEEAYSLAILLAERQAALKRHFQVQIFATDIDRQAIGTARAGLFPASIAADVPPERLARFFAADPAGGAYRIHKAIRDMVIFSEQDVIRDPPFSRLALISCRNLMIYMGVDLQRKLIPLFHHALSPGGYLFLGTSESVGELTMLFRVEDRKAKLYQRKDDALGAPRATLARLLLPRAESAPQTEVATRAAGSEGPSLRELTEQALLGQLGAVAALVDVRGDVLYLHGRAGAYLEPAPGEAGVSNLLEMAREGLRRELTSALHRAATGGEPVRCPGVRVRTHDGYSTVHLSVCPVETRGRALPGLPTYLVVFAQAPEPDSAPGEAPPGIEPGPAGSEASVAALRRELRAKEEYLQTANEELRSANEELQSVNEELQSTNEELETSKEELQSVNEELTTVNAELQSKVAELSRSNNDMNNLLSGTGIATVFVDHQLRILRFTPTVTRIINLIQGDVGRPVGDIVSSLQGYDALLTDTRAVLDTLIPRELEVQTRSGDWYTLRIQPYRTLENVIEGAVITFVDISKLMKLKEGLRSSSASGERASQAPPRGGADDGQG